MFDTFDAFIVFNSRSCKCWDFWHCWFSPWKLLRQSATISSSNWSNSKSWSQVEAIQKVSAEIYKRSNFSSSQINQKYILSYPLNTVQPFLINACNIPVFEQMAPAPSVPSQLSTVRWGQSRRDVSLPVHCTLSIPKVLETDPNWECVVCCP